GHGGGGGGGRGGGPRARRRAAPAARRELSSAGGGLTGEAPPPLASRAEFGESFERGVAAADGAPAKAIANWVTGELVAALRQADSEDDPLASKATPEAVGSLAGLGEAERVSHGAGEHGLGKLLARGGGAD